MKLTRRSFLGTLAAFVAAPLAFVGAPRLGQNGTTIVVPDAGNKRWVLANNFIRCVKIDDSGLLPRGTICVFAQKAPPLGWAEMLT